MSNNRSLSLYIVYIISSTIIAGCFISTELHSYNSETFFFNHEQDETPASNTNCSQNEWDTLPEYLQEKSLFEEWKSTIYFSATLISIGTCVTGYIYRKSLTNIAMHITKKLLPQPKPPQSAVCRKHCPCCFKSKNVTCSYDPQQMHQCPICLEPAKCTVTCPQEPNKHFWCETCMQSMKNTGRTMICPLCRSRL